VRSSEFSLTQRLLAIETSPQLRAVGVNVFPRRLLDFGPLLPSRRELNTRLFCLPVGLPLPTQLLGGVYSLPLQHSSVTVQLTPVRCRYLKAACSRSTYGLPDDSYSTLVAR